MLNDINLYMSAFLLIVLWFYLKQVRRLLANKPPLELKQKDPIVRIHDASA
jgi:hypothetical protein